MIVHLNQKLGDEKVLLQFANQNILDTATSQLNGTRQMTSVQAGYPRQAVSTWAGLTTYLYVYSCIFTLCLYCCMNRLTFLATYSTQ